MIYAYMSIIASKDIPVMTRKRHYRGLIINLMRGSVQAHENSIDVIVGFYHRQSAHELDKDIE